MIDWTTRTVPTAALITNPKSGLHLEEDHEHGDVRQMLREVGIEAVQLEGDVGAQIRDSVDHEADIVLVDGGDGTINAAIAAHVGSKRPIGIIPGGTMNLLATDYGIPSDRREAISVIAGGHTRPIDIGSIDGKVFLHTALTGLPVRVGIHREHLRGRLSMYQKLRLAWHAMTTRRRDPKLTLRAQLTSGEEAEAECAIFAFVVGAIDGTILPRPVRAELDAGYLTAYAVDPDSGLELAEIIVRSTLGDIDDSANVRRLLLSQAHLSGNRRKTHTMLDGEAALISLPAEIHVDRNAVRIFAPEGAGAKEPSAGRAETAQGTP